MQLTHKAYKFRIYPNKKQAILLAKHFGSVRFLYNYFLNERKNYYLNHKEDDKRTLTFYDNCKQLTELKKSDEFIWLKEINSQSLQASIANLDNAYNKFFRKESDFPRFKKKTDKQSFTIPQNIFIENDILYIPKFKQGIKLTQHREIEGKICYANVSKTSTNKYFISLTCEVEQKPLDKIDKQVGIDLGIKDLVICSDGVKFQNIKTTKKYAKRLAFIQRQHSKKTKGGRNRSKARFKVAKIHEKITNSRINYLHNISSKLTNENQVICLEDLAVKNMVKNHKLAKSISDCSWNELVRQIKYKSEWKERQVYQINRFFPSSKTCSVCDYINQDLKLEHRDWTCFKCGTKHDRDLNASLNILRQGLNLQSGYGTQSDLKQKHVESSGSKQRL